MNEYESENLPANGYNLNNVNNENNNNININNQINQEFDMNNAQDENDSFNTLEQEEELARLNEPLISKISSRDLTDIINDIIPSFLFIIFLTLPFYYYPKYCNLNIYLSMKTLIVIYILFILKALIKLGIIHFNQYNKVGCKIFLLILTLLTNICYYICLYLSYIIYSQSEPRCFRIDTFTIFIFFSIIIIGVISFFQTIINLVMLFVYFIYMIEAFVNNPIYFYNHYGMDPEMIKNLPTIKADKKHICTCVICLKDIKEGDSILILNCPGKHYFHGDCIKDWLLIKTTCPMCRSELIL